MSIKVTTYVWENSNQSGTALLLMLAVADHAHDDGAGAYPSIATLARKARTSERHVKRLLHTLERSGELEVKRGRGPRGTNLYRVRGVPFGHPRFYDGSNDGSGAPHSTPNVPQMSPPDARDVSPYSLEDYLESKRKGR